MDSIAKKGANPAEQATGRGEKARTEGREGGVGKGVGGTRRPPCSPDPAFPETLERPALWSGGPRPIAHITVTVASVLSGPHVLCLPPGPTGT